jgi:hypothetical protein
MSTGVYVAIVKLAKRVLGILPMFGQKVIIKFEGGLKICKRCYHYHMKARN